MSRHAIAAALLAAALAGCATSGGPPATGTTATASPSLAAASPTGPPPVTPVATIAVEQPGWFTFDGTAVWVLTGAATIVRIDPATNAVTATFNSDLKIEDGGSFPIAVTPTGVWIADFQKSAVVRLDPASGSIVATITAGSNPSGIAADGSATWVANHRSGDATRIDPETNSVVATVVVGKAGRGGPHEVGLGLGSVWVSAGNTNAVVRVDAATNEVLATIDVPTGASACSGFAISSTAVWTASCDNGTVLTRIDPVTNTVVIGIELNGHATTPILIDGVPWLIVAPEDQPSAAPRLVRIDPLTNRVSRELSLGETFGGGGLMLAADSVWVGDWVNNRVLRLPLSSFE